VKTEQLLYKTVFDCLYFDYKVKNSLFALKVIGYCFIVFQNKIKISRRQKTEKRHLADNTNRILAN